MRVKIIVHTPKENAEAMRRALGDSGAGAIGNYSHCSFTTSGHGRFKPIDGANPYIGKVNNYETTVEECIEVVCDKTNAKEVIAALKATHPYEEPAFQIIPLLEERDL